VFDMDLSWGRLHGNLAGQGVPSIDEAYQELHLAPLLGPFGALMSGKIIRAIHTNQGDLSAVPEFAPLLEDFVAALATRLNIEIDAAPLVARIQHDLDAIYACPEHLAGGAAYPELQKALAAHFDSPTKALPGYRVLIAWALVR